VPRKSPSKNTGTQKRAAKKPTQSEPVGRYRLERKADGAIALHLDRLSGDGIRKGDRLEVRYLREDPDDATSIPIAIEQVCLTLRNGATPSDIRRFGWQRWLSVVEAAARWRPSDDGTAMTKVGTHALRAEGVLRERRPGRRGHPPAFYKSIAERYIALVAQGVHDPRAAIARETGKSVDTVAGWLRRARELKYLERPTQMRRRQ
jgi:hypothetical protein